jgi:hypothetical protein
MVQGVGLWSNSLSGHVKRSCDDHINALYMFIMPPLIARQSPQDSSASSIQSSMCILSCCKTRYFPSVPLIQTELAVAHVLTNDRSGAPASDFEIMVTPAQTLRGPATGFGISKRRRFHRKTSHSARATSGKDGGVYTCKGGCAGGYGGWKMFRHVRRVHRRFA